MTGGRTDGRDLIAEAVGAGYQFTADPAAFSTLAGPRILALLALDSLTTLPPEPQLPELTGKALDLLNGAGAPADGEPGFFLMVEGSQIDWAGHSNDSSETLRLVLLFDLAVKTALEFAKQDGHTLVLVTADHATGGLDVRDDDGEVLAEWSSTKHTATRFPCLPMGPVRRRLPGYRTTPRYRARSPGCSG